jgi:general secretion pathway protein K
VKEKGIALMMTLWVLVLLTVLAMNLSLFTRHGSRSTLNFKEDAQAYFLAVSAYEEAIGYLLTDTDPQVDFMDEDGNFRTDAERDPVTGIREMDDAWVELRISDEESRLNINRTRRDVLLRLLDYVGMPGDTAEDVADSLADWKDPDDLHHLQGAEDEYYEDLGYITKSGPLDVPEELLLVKGVTPEYYYGTEEDTVYLRDLITTWGTGINVNTVSGDVLEVLGLSAVEIDTILGQREAQDGLRSVNPNKAGVTLTKSSNFRIQVVARVSDNPMALRITSVVRRTSGKNGVPELRTLYWKEDFESSGT